MCLSHPSTDRIKSRVYAFQSISRRRERYKGDLELDGYDILRSCDFARYFVLLWLYLCVSLSTRDRQLGKTF